MDIAMEAPTGASSWRKQLLHSWNQINDNSEPDPRFNPIYLDGFKSAYEGGLDRLRLSLILSSLFKQPVYLTKRIPYGPGDVLEPEHVSTIKILSALVIAAIVSDDFYLTNLLFDPHIMDQDGKTTMMCRKWDGSAAMLFLTILPYVLFCHLGSRDIGAYDYPKDYGFSFKTIDSSYVLSSNGPSIIYLQKVFLPNLSLLGVHPRSFVDLSMTKVENRFPSQPDLYITTEELELEISINPLVAPLKRRIDLTNRGEIWKVTAYAHCPDYVSSRFTQLLENEMCAAFHCQQGPRYTGSQENSDTEKLIEVEHVQTDPRNSPEPTESYIGYELTRPLPCEIINQEDKVGDASTFVSSDEQADGFILDLIRDGLRGLRAELLHGHAVDRQQTWGFMSFYQLMAPSYVDWNDGSRRMVVKEFREDYSGLYRKIQVFFGKALD
ncbi:hypothetical protein B0H65DRAFT_491143 [Neurospora tetraspora]|uniref:RNA 3'-terminal phosphate cyclase domain-containing protein n=1 Tax=Neurospora tetraspora TaxID=94610 RepID=A0AAE0JH84_9PEZI|nr:hypothetical protein B0H65DRAFT_491143 [Neurospora tetraspora]